MLLLKNSCGKTFFAILVEHRNSGLQNNRAGVQLLVHKMHCAAADFDAVLERLLLRVEAGKGGQQGGVNVQNPQGESPAKFSAEQAHETRKANQFYAALPEFLDNSPVIVFPRDAFGGNTHRRKTARVRDLQPAGLFTVGDYCRDLSRQTARRDVIGYRFKIRTPSG